MIVNKKIGLKFALPYYGGWVCGHSYNRDWSKQFSLVDNSGKITGIESSSICYDSENKMPVLMIYDRVSWYPKQDGVTYKNPIFENLPKQINNGSRNKQYFAIPGSEISSDFLVDIPEEEKKQLIVFSDCGCKILEMPIKIEFTCFSEDAMTVIAGSMEGFVIIDNPFI